MTNSTKFKPTYLYIKRHAITGKLYFGKTIRKDVEAYNGSGSRWNNHIAHHGKEHVETIWWCEFLDEESIKEFALMCSEQWNIVKSENWLNLIPENGLLGAKPDTKSGMTGKNHTAETRLKLSIANKGKKQTAEIIAKRAQSLEKTRQERGRNFGAVRTEESKAKYSASNKGRIYEKVNCPHCNSLCATNNLARHIKVCTNPKPAIAKIDGRTTAEYREKQRLHKLGKPGKKHTEEAKQKISAHSRWHKQQNGCTANLK